MTTFAGLVDEVIDSLLGYTRDLEQTTHLTAGCDADDLTLSVNDATRTSRGIVEIEDELIVVDSVDTMNGILTLAPYGRGHRGTTAASHAQNVRVAFAPRYPRQAVKRAINDTILSLRNWLFTVNRTTFDFTPAVMTYALPAGTINVLSVSYESLGPSGAWTPITRWRVDATADTGEYATGKTIDILSLVDPGREVQVVYTAHPAPFTSGSQEFTAATGLDEGAKDIVTYGALARLVGGVDAARLDVSSVEADQLDEPSPAGGGTSLAKFYLQMHYQRRAEERERLLATYSTQAHRTR